jgi:hypothetical protein
MRDPGRIPEVLAEIERVWKDYPDMRLGQLIVNVTGISDPYFVENDKLLECLTNWKESE